MSDHRNMPAQLANRTLAPSTGEHRSLIARGMNALINIDNDAIYSQARKTYNEITDNGVSSWVGAQERKSSMTTVFKAFQGLAIKNYGKAFFPLSTIYNGKQSIEGNPKKAEDFNKQAFDWLHENEHLNDPEIWCDLGVLNIGDNNELAVYWFQKGADVGDASCMWMLSGAYAFGGSVEQDWDKARYWQIKAAIAEHAKAQHGLEIQHNHGDLDIDDEQVFDWYIWSAEQGYVWAQVLLADTYFRGHTMENHFEGQKEYCSYWHDEEQAAYWYEKAAIQGDSHAQLQIGQMYWHGLSCIEQGHEDAKLWLEKSIIQGEPEAQHQFGLFLFEMSEAEQAIALIQCAADQNYGPAQYDYARLLSQGNDDLSDEDLEYCCHLFESASHWYFERTSESSDLELRYDYAMMHLENWNNWRFNKALRANRFKGLSLLREIASEPILVDQPLPAYNVERRACRILGKRMLNDNPDEEQVLEAIHWLSKAVDLGGVTESASLAELYLYGHAGGGYRREAQPKLIEIDQELAVSWYERGIQLGWMMAADKLGCHYLEGKYLPQNLVLAEKWLLHSSEEGYAPSQTLLGMEYASGLRFQQDSGTAIHWLSAAVTNGEYSATLALSEIYFDGKIILQNFDEAMKLLSLLRVKNDTRWNDAMKLIEKKCLGGQFDTAQKAIASKWMTETANMSQKRASDTEDHMHMCWASHLAELYELGLGFKKDREKAIYWYRASGSARSKEHLRGLGIE